VIAALASSLSQQQRQGDAIPLGNQWGVRAGAAAPWELAPEAWRRLVGLTGRRKPLRPGTGLDGALRGCFARHGALVAQVLLNPR